MNINTLSRFAALGLFALPMCGWAEDVKITGEASCAKCALSLTAECQNAITVTGKDGKKEVILVEQNALAKDFHSVICQDPVKVKAEGVLAEQNGRKVITLTKIVEDR